MTRTEEREQAFVLIFEKEFNMDTSMDDIISYAAEADVFSESAFASSLAKAVFENIDAVDAVIDKYSIGWKKSTLAILRLAICEMMFVDSIPESVSINEAVELAKKYATAEDASFVNGILGSYSRDNKNE